MGEIERFDANYLQSIAAEILQEAKKSGAESAEVSLSVNKGFAVRAHDGNVETVEYHQGKSCELEVYMGKRIGVASITDFRSPAIKDAVAAACHLAKFTDNDEAAGLADKSELAFHYPHLKLAYPWDITVDKAIELALDCEREALSMDKRLMSAEEVAVVTSEGSHLYANSLGFMGHNSHTRHEIACVVVAKDESGMQRNYDYTIADDPSLLLSPAMVARNAAQKTVQHLGARRLKTTKAPVIYIAEEARALLGHFSSAIAGSAIYKKNSFLVDQLDEKIFPEFVHLQEFPHVEHALGSSPFDGNGVLTRDNVFIEKGVLKSYALSVYSARKLGLKTTGNAGGTHNLTINPGKHDLAGLLKLMGKGLLVTETMGQGVSLLTGDYSRGVAGFWVENGEIQFPVHEVTVASNLKDMYGRLVAVGNDVDVRGNIRTGSLLIDEVTIAGE